MTALARRGVAAAVFLTAAATAAGCAPPTQTVQGHVAISPSAANREYGVEMQVLTMAPGWQWSRTVAFPTSGPDGAPVVYQKGFGTTRADHEWYCSWENRLVTPGLTEVDYARARAELAKVRTKHMYRFDILPVDRPLFNRILNSALKGKLSLMRRDVALNCSSGRAAL